MLVETIEPDIHLNAFHCNGTFSRQLRGKMTSNIYNIQAHELDLIDPKEGTFRSQSHCLIGLAFNPQTALHGTYADRVGGYASHKVSDLIFIPADTALRWAWEPGAQRTISCMFEIEKLGALGGLEWNWNNIDIPATLNLHNNDITAWMKTICAEILNPGFASELKLESILTLIALELRRHFFSDMREEAVVAGKLNRKQLDVIKEKIDAARDGELSLATLALACDLSPKQLSISFKRTTGLTLRQYAANTRVKKARALLSDAHIMIKKVGYLCGFQTAAAFSSAFRKATGMTPQQYRDNCTDAHSATSSLRRSVLVERFGSLN